MNTADEVHRRRNNLTRNSNSLERVRKSTELSSSRSSKARIKIISTKFPEDFFKNVQVKLEVQRKEKVVNEPQSQQATPKFSNKRSLRELKVPPYLADNPQLGVWNRITNQRQPGQIHKRYSDSMARPIKMHAISHKRVSITEEKICSYLREVIDLTSSLKNKKKGFDHKKYSMQVKGSIFNRENIELPPLVQRNLANNPQIHL